MSEIEFGNPINVDYEKKYKEAIVKLKEHFTPTSDGIVADNISRGQIEDMFPELVESEDERIRKALIEYFTTSDNNTYYAVCGVDTKKILAWLERQSKQNPFDKDEDEKMLHTIIADYEGLKRSNTSLLEPYFNENITWLKSLKQRWRNNID